MKKILVLLLISFLVTSCATTRVDPLDSLTAGMSSYQVRQRLGAPIRLLQSGYVQGQYLEVQEYDIYGDAYAIEFWDDYLTSIEYLGPINTYGPYPRPLPGIPPSYPPSPGRPIIIVDRPVYNGGGRPKPPRPGSATNQQTGRPNYRPETDSRPESSGVPSTRPANSGRPSSGSSSSGGRDNTSGRNDSSSTSGRGNNSSSGTSGRDSSTSGRNNSSSSSTSGRASGSSSSDSGRSSSSSSSSSGRTSTSTSSGRSSSSSERTSSSTSSRSSSVGSSSSTSSRGSSSGESSSSSSGRR